jgi:hypothetical protein
MHTDVINTVKIYGDREEYCAWPSVVKLPDAGLVAAFCVSDEHLGPTGSILSTRSADGGTTWTEPTVILDSVIDDRESGLTLLSDGSLMAHVWSTHHTRAMYSTLAPLSYEEQVIESWIESVEAPGYRDAAGLEGARTSTSDDGGATWTEPVDGTDSVHGGCLLADGSVLLASYRICRPQIRIYVGSGSPVQWRIRSQLPLPPLASTRFGEPHVAALPNGRVLLALRSTAMPYDDGAGRNLLWMTYSDDEGRTWAEPYPTPLWGFPPHLLVLGDGRVLCTYGYRRAPFGQRACISEDGVTWRAEDEIIIRDDGENGDLGYPASAEVEPGKIVTVYYQPQKEDAPARMRPPDPARSKPDIYATTWSIHG